MKKIKIHICNNKRAWFTPKGRLWHVEGKGVQLSYRTIEEMLRTHPEFASIPEIQASVDRHIEKAKRKKDYLVRKESKKKLNLRQLQKLKQKKW